MSCYLRFPEAFLNNRVTKNTSRSWHFLLRCPRGKKPLNRASVVRGTNYKLCLGRGDDLYFIYQAVWLQCGMRCVIGFTTWKYGLAPPATLIASSRKFWSFTLSLALMLSSQFVRFGLVRSSCMVFPGICRKGVNRFAENHGWSHSRNRRIGKKNQTKSLT